MGTPNGEYFAQFNTINTEEGTYIDIFNFDRCTGVLSNQIQLWYDEDAQAGGIAFSPNSRFLYVSSFNNLYQYDMWATDIEASREKVGEYDGYLENGFWASHFHLAQLAPDNKIYITTPVDGHYLHVIHNPDEKGTACNVELRGLEWPTWKNISIPNFPHYRMGALEGSACDTLSVSVDKIEFKQDLKVYPNPASSSINVSLRNSMITQINLFTTTAQHLETYSLRTNHSTLDVSNYQSGVYLLEVVTTSGQRHWQKVIIQ